MWNDASEPGRIMWADLTVPDAPKVRDFYEAVLGWKPSPVSMGDYQDFNMLPPGSNEAAAGVCHARGGNANLPAQWIVYVPVKDLPASIATCERLGGKVLQRSESGWCLIQDPAGAVMMVGQATASK